MKRAVLLVVLAGCGGGEVDVGARSPAPIPAPSGATPAACALAHATSARVGARCALLACDEAFADCDLALGPGFAVVADLAGERVLRVDPASRATLASGRFASVVLVGGVAYALRLAGATPGAIVRLPLDGGAPSELVTGLAVTDACRIAADETRVWWTDPDAEIVWRAPLAGGAAEPWATRQRLACGVVVDADRAHWIAVDPTLAVFVVSVAKETSPDPDWIRSAAPVGHYAPQKTAWDLTRSPSAVFFVSTHDGAVVRVAGTGEASLVAGAQTVRGVAFAEGPAWATPEGVVQLAMPPGAGP